MTNQTIDNTIKKEDFTISTNYNFIPLQIPNSNATPVAIDIGYSSVKVVSSTGKFIFPSLPLEIGLEEIETTKTEDTDIRYMDEDGTIWYVGKLASRTNGDIDYINLYNEKRINTKEYQILYRVGLSLGLMDSNYIIQDYKTPVIISGLPEKYLSQDTIKLINQFKGSHHYKIKIGNQDWQNVDLRINEDNIIVKSQPFGTLFSMCCNYKGENIMSDKLLNHNIVIFDGGFHSVDLFNTNDGIKGTSMSLFNVSMQEVYKRLKREILNVTDRDIDVYEINKYIDRDFTINYGRKNLSYNFKQDMVRIIGDVAQKAIDKLNSTYENFNDIDAIVVTGGTGKAFYPYFCNKISKEIILAEVKDKNNEENFDTIFANAVGFFNYYTVGVASGKVNKEVATTKKTKTEKEIKEESLTKNEQI